MESTDNKPPSKPAPGRPSLLDQPAGPAAQTSILASLERGGSMPGIASTRGRPSRRRYGLAALLAIVVGGAGAFLALKPSNEASTHVAASTPPSPAISAAPAERPASVTETAASSAVAASDAAARIELAAVAAAAAPAEASSMVAPATAASQVPTDPLDKFVMSEALSAAAVPAVAQAAPHRKVHAGVPKKEAHPKPRAETAVAAHAEAKAAERKLRKHEDDADTDLVAAIIARLDKRGPQPAAAGEPTAADIAGKVRRCSANSDPVEARHCRNRACDGYWGKVDACPAARAPKTSRGEGADDGRPG